MTTTKRDEVLNFIKTFIREHGYGPSVREIMAAVNLLSTATVYYHLWALKEAGLIIMEEGKKRAISLPREETAAPAVTLLEPVQPKNRLVPWWAPWPPDSPFWPWRTWRVTCPGTAPRAGSPCGSRARA